MKKALLAFFFISLFTLPSYASHLMGGEITWECLGTGQFVFTMKLYRDCNGFPAPASPNLTVFYCPGLNTIPLTLVSATDNSPVCNPAGPEITCDSAQFQPCWPNCATPVLGANEEYIYQSAPIYISGTPPATGWIFTYGYCCRNWNLTNIVNPGDVGMTLRAKMFSYNGMNTNPCYDASPQFFEKPKAISCTGFPFTFNQNAISPNLDSLNYAWAEPLDTVGADGCGALFTPTCPPALVFAPNYSYTNPLPGIVADARNVPAQLNPNTGEITYTSFTQGYFVMVVQVSAYKCGVLVSQVYREIQVILANCAEIVPGEPNSPPLVVPPFLDSAGKQTSYIDTVYAGALVDFFLTCTDNDTTASGSYLGLSMTASGPEFDSTFTNSNGVCLLPPCATLTPPPTVTGQQSLTTEFKWQTTCHHLGFSVGCANFSNTYTFIIQSANDFCPIPGTTLSTITIVVLPPPTLPPPLLKCVAVAANGDVTISWVPKPDTGNTFHSFYIYYSQSQSGPYTLIDSVLSYAQTSYTHVGANANVNPAYYYIVVNSGCPTNIVQSTTSDTLQAMQLAVENPPTGYAVLNWNSTHTPPVSSNSKYYQIYKEYPPGVWTLIDSTQLNSYNDPITVCSDSINYQIQVSDSSGCTSVSTINGKQFKGILTPATPLMDSVSVNGGGFATLSWNQDSSNNVIGYIIYISNSNGNFPIDTVWGINNLSFTTPISGDAKSDSFCVAAFDSCEFHTSALSLIQNTIYVTGALDICANSITLTWNPFINWPVNVKEYQVFASVNGGAFNFVGSSTTTTFVQDSLITSSSYCYFIRAIDETGARTSSSNEICITVPSTQVPKFQYLRKATVINDNTALITAYIDTSASIMSYKIIRSSESGGPYDTIGVVPFDGSSFISFMDNNAPVGQRSYYYKIIAVDTCGNNTFTSQYGRTIFASVTANNNLSNTINWNEYEIWLGGVDHYNIYRNIDGVTDATPLATVPFGKPDTYTDNIADFNYASGKFCYYIEAVEGAGDTYGFVDTSISNQACAVQQPIVFIPNAFRPDGTINNVFAPFSSFVNAQVFSIDIYNRWGELFFHSDNPGMGWDGTYKGHDAAEGVYIYFAKIVGTDGTNIQRNGTITLLR